MIERRRRLTAVVVAALLAIGVSLLPVINQADQSAPPSDTPTVAPDESGTENAAAALGRLAVKGRAPKTGYSRDQFGSGWRDLGACDTRNAILKRDLTQTQLRSAADCTVMSGHLRDPYTGKAIVFARGPGSSSAVQIDHVVALSDAWQKGAQQLSRAQREQLANDPLELIAVDGPANMDKSDGDAATWLPPNKAYRCRYVARQIAVKLKYELWVTAAEQSAMNRILTACPQQRLPVVETAQ